jgi:hypothetical protein
METIHLAPNNVGATAANRARLGRVQYGPTRSGGQECFSKRLELAEPIKTGDIHPSIYFSWKQ